MKLLTATLLTQGNYPFDYDAGVIAGELVEPCIVCDSDLHNDAMPCGCGLQFLGMTSDEFTTTAIVTDMDISAEQLHEIVAAKHGNDPYSTDSDITRMTSTLADYCKNHDVGTVVGIRRYQLIERSEPATEQ